jgi:DNA primase
MSREHPKSREKSEWSLPEAIEYIAQKFGFAPKYDDFKEELVTKNDFTIIKNYDRIKDIDVKTQQVELKEYDSTILTHLPHKINILPWLEEGIKKEVMDDAGICYNPKSQAIVIPHYDINNRLIGIRERTLVEENAELYGKYRPAYIGGKLYNHPLSFNLYNLNNSKDNIRRYKKAFIFEGEKSTLLYRSYFGKENDISTAICGSSFIAYQCWLLINCGAEEIIVALDKQYKELGDDEHKKLVKNLKNIHKKYGAYVKISYLFDKEDLLDYKDSPTDKGVDVLLELYNNKFSIY